MRISFAIKAFTSAFLLLSVISYNQFDDGIYGYSGEIQNTMGYVGAIFSDFLIIFFGKMVAIIFAILFFFTPIFSIPTSILISFSISRFSVSCTVVNIFKTAFSEAYLSIIRDYFIAECILLIFSLIAVVIINFRYKKWEKNRKIVSPLSLAFYIIESAASIYKKIAIDVKNEISKFKDDDSSIKKAKKSNNLFHDLSNSDNEDQKKDDEKFNKRADVPRPDKISKINQIAYKKSEDYYLPPLSLLAKDNYHVDLNANPDEEKALLAVLNEFGVNGEISSVNVGPVVTLYEFRPAAGTKSSRVIGLSDDIAMSMSAVSARIAVIPGKNAIGIELPNKKRSMVYIKSLLEDFDPSIRIPLALGRDISGKPVVVDLAKMPHLLVAGTTGSGKSVGINAMIISILYKYSHHDCRFIMIDPKMLELSVYEGIPHLLSQVVTDPKKAVTALKWAVNEMERRYRSMSQFGVRNLDGYNALVSKGENIEREVQIGFDDDGVPIVEKQVIKIKKLPLIVIIVDEMADLMLVAGKEIEVAVQRIAQMARAAGIHLIMATQRPSVDVITGTIKANFPTRISFQMSSSFDSKTILGERGAEQLLGHGDMLYMYAGGNIRRIHGPFVSDQEVENVVASLKQRGYASYDLEFEEDLENSNGNNAESGNNSGEDPLYLAAVEIIKQEGKVSISYIQRKLEIGYNRAARLVEVMETKGIVSKPNKLGRREILI